ncbi:MAG: hypothetical protein KIT68_09535 [Phycisphaeraceae bacterium]|nr:hypothetical protein [Phycisphaeraceae bacterium]
MNDAMLIDARPTLRLRPAAGWMVCLAAALLAGGCSGGSGGAAGGAPVGTESGTAAADPMDRAGDDLKALYTELQQRQQRAAPAPTPTPAPVRQAERPRASAATATEPAPPPAPERAMVSTHEEPPAAGPAARPVETAAQRRERLIAELTEALSHGGGSEDPFGRAVDLTIVESLRPGSSARALEELRAGLTPPQIETLGVLRELLAAMPRGGTGGDTTEIARLVSKAAARLSAGEQLRIPVAALCRRVEGYGRYVPLGSANFLAGRAHPAIVYVEVANFAHRPVSGSPGGGEGEYAVELSQELNLFHDADGLLAWRSPERSAREVSRNMRRDYFLTQRIDLPPTLTVGRYRLKVIVRDKTSGAQAETTIAINIVADAALTTPPPGAP